MALAVLVTVWDGTERKTDGPYDAATGITREMLPVLRQGIARSFRRYVMAVSGTEKNGNDGETPFRRTRATAALGLCLPKYPEGLQNTTEVDRTNPSPSAVW
jgi:hypothetical protein